MIDPLSPPDDGPSIDDAKAATGRLGDDPVLDAAGLPNDVRDGEASEIPGEDDPAIADVPPTTDAQ